MLLSLTKVPESMKEDIKLFMEGEDFTYFALLAFKTFGHVNQEIMAFIKNDVPSIMKNVIMVSGCLM